MGDIIQLNMKGTQTGRLSFKADKKFPIMEIFGPVIQGEGILLGMPTYFIRFGGCDSRCDWCDTKYAVEPDLVASLATRMTEDEIVDEIGKIPGARWVTLSGGNPALFNLGPLVTRLKTLGYNIAVETQATVYKPWLMQINSLVLSPKPPSSGNELKDFSVLDELMMAPGTSLKIVIDVDQHAKEDLDFAETVWMRYPMFHARVSLTLQPMTSKDNGKGVIDRQLDAYDRLCRMVVERPNLYDAMIRPRMHELIGMR